MTQPNKGLTAYTEFVGTAAANGMRSRRHAPSAALVVPDGYKGIFDRAGLNASDKGVTRLRNLLGLSVS